jgi:foldase protein PrsA
MKLRTLPALAAALILSASLAACGDSVPGNAVARIGDDSITKTTFNHWMQVAALSAQAQTQTSNATTPKANIPEPPDFKACIADKQRTAPKPARGQPRPTAAQFKAQCKQQYEGMRDQVLQFLISSHWIEGEAADQGIKLSDAEVRKQLETAKKQSFPKEADFKKFLQASGMTEEDMLFRQRGNLFGEKLREKITKGKDKVTDAQISQYYAKNKQRFAQPERRDLRIVLTKTKAKADEARAAIAAGQSFKAVARTYSIDQASKAQGGVLLAVAKGQQEKSLDAAVFKASKGALTGPVKTQFGYYVFKVQKITKASQQTLTQAKETIRQLLVSQNQQKALDEFVKGFRKKWKEDTNCREGFVVQDCKNAPKPKETTGQTPPGAVPNTPQPTPTTGG